MNNDRDFLAGLYVGFCIGAVCGSVMGIVIWGLVVH